MSTAASLTLAGRKFHEQIMDDACVVSREGNRVLNEATGQYAIASTPVYSGPCRLVVQPRPPKDANAVGQVEAVTNARCDFPVSTSTGIRDGDVVTFTVSVDPALVGEKYRLRGLAGQTHATARRFFVEAYT